MAVVTVRLEPQRVYQTVSLLYVLEFRISSGIEVYQKACELSASSNQHLFDTLYRAVAFTEPDAKSVTADEHYYRKAHKAGKIVRLKEYGLVL